MSILSILAMIATGVDNLPAFAAMAATLNNPRPGLGIVTDNFTSMNAVAKWILILTMLFGRLEVFTLFVCPIYADFWRE